MSIMLPKKLQDCNTEIEKLYWIIAHDAKLVKCDETKFEEFYRVEVNDHE